MPEYVITLTAIAIVGGLILGAIYFFYNSYRTETAALRADIKAADAKTDRTRMELDAKTDTLRSEMSAGFARLDAKIDSKTDDLHAKIDAKTDSLEDTVEREISGLRSDMGGKIDHEIGSLRSDLGGRIDANTEKLSELATEVQVHLRTHHLMSEIERITTPPAPRAEEERELEEEANQPS